jgi:hypothetical protein
MLRKIFQRLVALVTCMAICSAIYGAENPSVNTERRARMQKAAAMFQERCKDAGEKIRRTAESVDGILLMKLRPTNYSDSDQNAVDPYGYDFDWGYKDKPQPYIGTFLWGRNDKGRLVQREPAVSRGYEFVDAVDPVDGRRYRYTGSRRVVGRMDETAHNVQVDLRRDPNFDLNLYDFVVDKVLAPSPMPRYGVTYDDITTREEREYWIAGSSLKVIDLRTNEVMAERIGYMIDMRLGDKAGFRQPWTYAMKTPGWSCPALVGSTQTRIFVEKVLKNREK